MLLLLQFLFDHSEIFTGETRHIVPPYNKAGISNFFCLEFQKLQKLQLFFKTLLFLQFLFNHSEIFTGETRHIFFFFFFFLVEENGVTWLWSLKTTTIFVHGPYFDPMTPPLGVLKSQSRTSAHLGSFPGLVPTVLPL